MHIKKCKIYYRDKGHWAVYNTNPQSFKITFSQSYLWLNNFGDLWNFDWLLYLVKYSNVSINNCNL